MNDKKAAAYRLGLITLGLLAVLTIGEYFVAVNLGSLVLLFIIAVVKAAIIVQNFMHITRLWREESH
ncbi:Cytochrome c oxidase subunit III (fragment) [Candidatus Promineifilum breve]|uniref:Cytochrome c oxidase subunit III n=1 Tax=Candidatus Promineifilum breve TaxID=1806508 RepID=A0A160T6S8_9CHLR